MDRQINTSSDWHWMDVRTALAKKGYTLARIGREKRYKNCTTVSGVRTRRWPDLQQFIADKIGVHPMEIWPSRYDSAGKPLGLGIRQKRSA